jgi:hypothetical protein
MQLIARCSPLTFGCALLITQYSRGNDLSVLGEHLLDVRLLERQRQIGQVQIGGILLLLLTFAKAMWGEEWREKKRKWNN